MIPADHQHVWQPFNTRDVGGGRQQIDSRCQCAGATVDDPGTIIEQRVIVDSEGRALSLQYRFGGMWWEPLDLLRIRPSTSAGDLEICVECHAKPHPIAGMPPCGTCHGLGLLAGGAAIVAPSLKRY